MAVETKVKAVPVRGDAAARLQGYWIKYAKTAAIVIVAAIVIFGGWFVYNSWIMQPKEEQAEKAIYKAQQYFAQDSSYKVLHGDGVNKGVLAIMTNYSGTKTANLAKFYAGVSYLKLGKFSDAINQLKDFTTDSKPVQMKAYGCLGDAYSELKKNTEAIDAYKKAASTFEADEADAAEYLFRAALLSEVSGNTQQAVDLYKQLKDKFPTTMRGSQADKYLYRLQIVPNEFSAK
ncbi:tetratricopeptide repeat protein [Ilyomonas limi]|uniref:Tetratricopeptide repeat protein n=1 Tax=Ilyomonas limi TaxID=2575867 RepID=A0A4U3L1Z4_9BACT|nr:tetratricopeptide repeat protein [Ilyomonas limi]TKK68234.1 tetratricopeptide repeat protein [Ilyomonas limi]